MTSKSDLNIAKSLFLRLLRDQLKLDPEYKRIRDEQQTLRAQIDGLEQFLRAAKVDVDALRATVKPSTEAERGSNESETLPEVIAQSLRSHGIPMHYRDITTALIDSGVEVPGKDQANTINAYIRQNKRIFTKAPEKGRGYYKLTEWEK